jgi:hypothetical protein
VYNVWLNECQKGISDPERLVKADDETMPPACLIVAVRLAEVGSIYKNKKLIVKKKVCYRDEVIRVIRHASGGCPIWATRTGGDEMRQR